jgi:hypothetical protein
MLSGKVAVISIAVETVNLGDAEVLAAGAAFIAGRAAVVFFFLETALTAGRAATVFFFFGVDLFVFLAMVYMSPYQKILPPGTPAVASELCRPKNAFIIRDGLQSGPIAIDAKSIADFFNKLKRKGEGIFRNDDTPGYAILIVFALLPCPRS